MTVKELIEQLQTQDQDAIVVMLCDSEWNTYSPLEEVDVRCYQAASDRQGDVVPWVETPEEIAAAIMQGWDDEDRLMDGVKAIALRPRN